MILTLTLTKLLVILGIVAIGLTFVQSAAGKIVKNPALSFLQNFVGSIFIFSGFVKAVDPLGTAFKMEQYFAEFESTFAATKADFLAPMFPFFAEYAIAFSVFMIVFEIFLGVTLISGVMKKFTAWAFFLLVLFFTFLTGYTYLTGYVPNEVNFFEFAQWGDYVKTNMKVTDCGCFGDFLVLDPKVSFMKDVFLMIPAIIFLFTTRSFHQLKTGGQKALGVGIPVVVALILIQLTGYSLGLRTILAAAALIGVQYLGEKGALAGTTVVLLLYCFSSYIWNIPEVDFRPFREGVNIAEVKAAEEEAANNVKVTHYKMTNKASGEIVTLEFDKYMEEYKKYPGEEWEFDQIKTEPLIERTKISDFEVSDMEGMDMTYDALSNEGYSVMIVAYKTYGEEINTTRIQKDSIFALDTIFENLDTLLIPRFTGIKETEVPVKEYNWDEGYLAKWNAGVNTFAEAAHAAGIKTYVATAIAAPDRIGSLQSALSASYPFYQADDILLKTIVRSNPGVVLMKDGEVINKWHHKTVPTFEELTLE